MPGRRPLTALAFALACLLALGSLAGSADAAPSDGTTTFKLPVCELAELAPAPGEGVLVPLCEKREGRIVESLGTLLPSGKLRKRSLPRGARGPFVVGPAGELWAGKGNVGKNPSIDRIAADGTVANFSLGEAKEGNARAIYDVVPEGEGAVWLAVGELAPASFLLTYLDSLGGELVHISADGTVARFPVPEDVEPHALVRGPDGDLWFAGESGRSASEHTSFEGKGYVGRMTPGGQFTLYPTAIEQSAPGGIEVGPDGRLWFTEASNYANAIGTIGTDGTFGPSTKVHGYVDGPLGFDPKGDAWLASFGGVTRITSGGQQTLFPAQEPRGLTVGAEGQVWTHLFKSVLRIAPGAPGIEASEVEADRSSKTVNLRLSCGGSEQGCAGELVLSLARDRGTKPGARLARAQYSVAPESSRSLALHPSAKAFALAREAVPKRAGHAYVAPVVVHATVAGGPTLDRRSRVPGLVPGS
jgi:streptogramin lyase